MINLTSGSPSSGMSSYACTPPVVNGDPSRAVPVGDLEQGACIRARRFMVHVWFKCRVFGINDYVCPAGEWPSYRKMIRRGGIVRVELVGMVS